jgi:hypothetical protein
VYTYISSSGGGIERGKEKEGLFMMLRIDYRKVAWVVR